VEVIFGEDNPAGGYEVVSKPPLGKCSINIIEQIAPREGPNFLVATLRSHCTLPRHVDEALVAVTAIRLDTLALKQVGLPTGTIQTQVGLDE
jgi:hypothetical protein